MYVAVDVGVSGGLEGGTAWTGQVSEGTGGRWPDLGVSESADVSCWCAGAVRGVGGVSDPFETQFGWHVATLIETRSQPLPTLDETRQQLTAELQEAAITAKLEELTASAVIERPEEGTFDVNLIGQIELLE